MKKELRRDIFNWDVYNWSRSIEFWESQLEFTNKNYKCLEIGAYQGGMSLWLAQKSYKVICSDRHDPSINALPLHQKYNVTNLITYSIIDALNIPFENEFDVVILKSVLGNIDENEKVTKAISQIYKSLKPGGYFVFVENLKASGFHMMMRRLFSDCGKLWNYLDYSFLNNSLKNYNKVNLYRFGMFGTFGRNELQREILGKTDKYFFEKIFPKKWFYILAGVARK